MFDKIKNAASNLGDVGNVGDLQKYVDAINFPASKGEILAQLRESGAQDELLSKVQAIGKEQFDSQSDFLSSFMGDR